MSAQTAPEPQSQRSRGKAAYPRKGERTRSRIIDIASQMFADSGYRSVSLRDISAQAGLTHVGLLHHFASKEALLLEVLARRDALQLPSAYASANDGPTVNLDNDRAMVVFAGTTEIVRGNESERSLIGLYVKLSAEATDPEHPAHDYFHRRYLRVLGLFEVAFTARFAHTPPPHPVPPRIAAQQLVALMDGIQLQWVLAEAADADADSPLNASMADAVTAFLTSLSIQPTARDLAAYRQLVTSPMPDATD